jgi:hypothetical protein
VSTKKPAWTALAGVSAVPVDPAVSSEPQASSAQPEQKPSARAASSSAAAEPERSHAVIKRSARSSKWPQLNVRVPEDLKAAYVAEVENGSRTGTEIVTEALNDWFRSHPPHSPYAEQLHDAR